MRTTCEKKEALHVSCSQLGMISDCIQFFGDGSINFSFRMRRAVDAGDEFDFELAENGRSGRLAVARFAASRRHARLRWNTGVGYVGADDRVVLPRTIESDVVRGARQHSAEREHSVDAATKNRNIFSFFFVLAVSQSAFLANFLDRNG